MPTLNQLCQLQSQRRRKLHKVRATQLRGCPHKRAIVDQVRLVKPKKPNSAIRKVAKVVLSSTRRSIIAYIPGRGHSLQKFSVVLVRGGRVKDLPGVQYHLVRGVYEFNSLEANPRIHRRSKYGVKKSLY